jgi:hypothetical protein
MKYCDSKSWQKILAEKCGINCVYYRTKLQSFLMQLFGNSIQPVVKQFLPLALLLYKRVSDLFMRVSNKGIPPERERCDEAGTILE